jgi:hypothetical protein
MEQAILAVFLEGFLGLRVHVELERQQARDQHQTEADQNHADQGESSLDGVILIHGRRS